MGAEISIGDLLALMNDRRDYDGFGGGSWMWVIFLFFIFAIFGGGFWGNRGNEVTRADLADAMNFNQMENGIRGLSNGLCDGFYAQNTGILQTRYDLGARIAENRFAAQQCCLTSMVA